MVEKIEEKVLKEIVPKKNYRKKLEETINKLTDKLKNQLKKYEIPIEIELVGSTAKDTYIKNSLDIDLFLCFPLETSKEKIQKIGLNIGRAVLKNREESYAEHPYVRGEFEGYKTEIVPCYKIESSKQKLSAVDRTPLHTKYVIKNLKEDQKNEVRLLKQFLKGIGCYGAEAQIEGFSGYLTELLIIKYGSFHKTLEAAKDWKCGEKIILKNEKSLDFDTPLVFIDPVDSERNVSSALSKDKFDLFINACKSYLTYPKITFFFPNKIKPLSVSQIEVNLGTKEIIGIKIEKPKIITENLYPQIRKASKSIEEEIRKHDFPIIKSDFFVSSSKIYLIFELEKINLSATIEHMGPPTKLKKNSKEFIKKWKDNPRAVKPPYEKNNRHYVEIIREYKNVKHLLKDKLPALSLGKDITELVKKQFNIVSKKTLFDEHMKLFWTTYIKNKYPWEW